ncbi:hypothetical protein PoB_005900000 [Plakobranchus ocellatus]|uniref:Uncharacterized protein n=1 Tax=Plakobranchus ocellatus TaxID=259542 RepID=A0AAV4CKT1_9GAST|nr:hypothetical protein PoB_005900000 [Plakobranchus ocellatus]
MITINSSQKSIKAASQDLLYIEIHRDQRNMRKPTTSEEDSGRQHKAISNLKTLVDRQTAQTERHNDRRYALVHGFLLTAPLYAVSSTNTDNI